MPVVRIHGARLATALLCLAMASGCSAATRAGNGSSAEVISREEILAARVDNAYDAVLRLRPSFFRDRGRTTLLGADTRDPVLYVDDLLYGEVTRLREIDAQTVWQIRFLSPSETQQKWGRGYPGGVIHVITLRTRPGS